MPPPSGVSVAFAHDSIGRLVWRKTGTLAAETLFYTNRGLIAYTNQLGNVTRYFYDEAGRKTIETNALVDRVQFSYDPSGNLTNLIDGKSQTTRWRYDQYGRLTNKIDHLGSTMFNYKYDANGRLTNRWTPAKGHTFYSYDAAGNLTFVNYTNSTDITLAYDAMGRPTNMVDAVGTTRYTFNAAGLLATEDGPWDSDTVTYGYNNRLRASLSLQQPNASAWDQTYGYDAARRFSSLTSPAGTFSYGYPGSGAGATLAKASPLHVWVGLPNGTFISNRYDSLARLTNTSLRKNTALALNAHGYIYNDANQRTRQTRTGADFVDYTYDNIGQLKTAIGKESGGTINRVHERSGYAYDAAGNLTNRTNNIFVQSFGVNSLNQLSGSSRSGTLTVAGTTTSAATNVTVNTSTAIRYADRTFASTNHTLANGTNTFTAIAQDSSNRVDTNMVVAYLPDSGVFVYDSNGNMVFDGQKAFEYDDENQLVRITTTNAWKSEFTYDGKMRRRIRKEYTWRTGVWALTNEIRYVYDGNLVIQERDANNVAQVSYTRGKDLSGELEEAGGIGGLLARTDHSTLDIQPSAANAYYHADSTGNITMLINTQQVPVAKYLYDPFGTIVSKSGTLADANVYGFSSKERHAHSGIVSYLYRYYDPAIQRWLNRDPAYEEGDRNLYRFAVNNPLNSVDPDGKNPVVITVILGLYGVACDIIVIAKINQTEKKLKPGECVNWAPKCMQFMTIAMGVSGTIFFEICKDCNGKSGTTPYFQPAGGGASGGGGGKKIS